MDRDGVINKIVLRKGNPSSPRKFQEFELLPGIELALCHFKEKGFLNIIVTNQPDIARGLMLLSELTRMHKKIEEELKMDDIMVCVHDDMDNCYCRKPKVGMLIEASKKWDIDLKRSFLVGDGWKDMMAGKEAGCTTILLDRVYNKGTVADRHVKDVCEIVGMITEGSLKGSLK